MGKSICERNCADTFRSSEGFNGLLVLTTLFPWLNI